MTTRHTVRIGLIQHACGSDQEKNLAKATSLIRHAAAGGAQIAVTQELFASLYFPQTEDHAHFALAETIPGPTTQRLSDLARELGICISASLFEKRTPGIYHNTSVMLSPQGQIIGLYRKMHIPDDPGFFEKFFFTPGSPPGSNPAPGRNSSSCNPQSLTPNSQLLTPDFTGWQVQTTPWCKTGMLICWDQWFPEAARLTAMRGAEILFYPTAIGWVPQDPAPVQAQQRRAWQTVQHAHAISNGLFVAAVNRVGTEGQLRFWGSSFVADPTGLVIAEASPDEETALLVDCDLSKIETQRQYWPFWRDRRIDAYGDLTRRFVD
ncbi:MAG: carbon-nitrogen hydrolase [Phycisphaeraceae bacterium]|nr:carbon-nitrogen hydrolase [Phycisphaeraceae bacterium]